MDSNDAFLSTPFGAAVPSLSRQLMLLLTLASLLLAPMLPDSLTGPGVSTRTG